LSRGFDASAAGGLGRSGRCERAVLAGGRVAVRSLPGEGTLVELRLGAGPPA
jgi:signal transduction histidine kinase